MAATLRQTNRGDLISPATAFEQLSVRNQHFVSSFTLLSLEPHPGTKRSRTQKMVLVMPQDGYRYTFLPLFPHQYEEFDRRWAIINLASGAFSRLDFSSNINSNSSFTLRKSFRTVFPYIKVPCNLFILKNLSS